MNSESRHTKDTDKAWQKLHTRLEKDNLINEKQPNTKYELSYKIWIGIAAIVFAGWFIKDVISPGSEKEFPTHAYCTLYNEKGSGTLIKTLQDGSTVYLDENTEIIYPEHFAKEKREVELKGNAFFEVTGNKDHPFLIHTNHTEIEVIGTSFEIRNPDKDTFELSVLSGEVKVSFIPPKSKHQIEPASRYVRAGESITLSSLGEWEYTHEVKSVILQMNIFSFRNELIKDIISVINKNTKQKEFIAIEPSLENERLTVSFSNHTLEEIAEILSLGVGAHWKRDNLMLLISD